ncbi:MAG: TIGR03960 family B12-binding radical SAM protein [Anaerolineales bacterium]|jgi:radical SAM family uncharacterized protein
MLLTPKQIEAKLDRILLKVQKPGRYVGGELNITVKDWEKVKTKVALIFPDIYDLGVSNVGLKILYDQVNQRDDALAERAYAPWIDMEAEMRENGIPLYALESKQPLACFDLIGFSLPYETLYTNTLNILDLAGIPVKSADRDDSHPIIIAGGHATLNPEPMHAFIDAFAIGEGEEVIHDIIEVIQRHKLSLRGRSPREGNSPKRGAQRRSNLPANEEIATTPMASRNDILKDLAHIPGVYVPQYYEPHYMDDGTLSHIDNLLDDIANPVFKRMVAKLPPPPTKFIVPNINVVHNRASVEIMRGCTRGCRFCHAGMITRPVRERSVDEIIEAAVRAVEDTGFEELALMSLSSSDFSHIVELTNAISERFKGQKLTISLPSLRIESVSIDLMDKLREHYSGGFTLAPEAATERMRRIINKYISDEEIIETTREIYRRGWKTIKLYFMIGHPSETMEDVKAIANLAKAVIGEGRKVAGMGIKLHVGFNTFVPKPQTPFQWVPLDTRENILKKQDVLRKMLPDRNIKLSWNDPEDSMMEAWLTRGDRKIADVVYTAWKNGAKFDAWGDQMKFDVWMAAFDEHKIDHTFYTHRQRRTDEVFPWEHISAAVRKNFLFQDFRMSLEGEIRVDCRLNCFACGILPTFSNLRRENPGEVWKCPDVKSPQRSAVSNQLPVVGD